MRPWDLPGLQRRAAALGGVSSAHAVSVDEDVLVAELLPGDERILFRGVEDEWRLVRFADFGQGETKTVYRYQWTGGGRSIIAEEVKKGIFDGATPYSTYVRGVIIDGDRGVLLTGRDNSALVIEG